MNNKYYKVKVFNLIGGAELNPLAPAWMPQANDQLALVTSIIKQKIEQWWGAQGMVWSNHPVNNIKKEEVQKNWTDDDSRQFITYILSDNSGTNNNLYLKGKTEEDVYIFFQTNKDVINANKCYIGPIAWFDDGITFIQRIIAPKIL